MATITVLVWLAALVLSFVALHAHSNDEDESSLLRFLLGAALGGSLALAEAIHYDFNGATINIFGGSLKFYLLWGVIALGADSLAIVGMQTACGRRRFDIYRTRQTPLSDGISIGGLVGFVASILGIISFYLDHISG